MSLAFALRVGLILLDTPMVREGDEPAYIGLGRALAERGRFEIEPNHNTLWQGLSMWAVATALGRVRWRISAAFAGAACVVVAGWVARNVVAVGKPVFSTQSEAFTLGTNRWTRGSLNGDVFTLGARSPQITPLLAKSPNYWRISEVERSQMWSREAKANILAHPKRQAWLLGRKTLAYLSPLQYWSAGFYKHHHAYVVALLAGAVGNRGLPTRRARARDVALAGSGRCLLRRDLAHLRPGPLPLRHRADPGPAGCCRSRRAVAGAARF